MSEERQEQEHEQPDRVGALERVERAQKHISRAEEILKENAEAADAVHVLTKWLSDLLSR